MEPPRMLGIYSTMFFILWQEHQECYKEAQLTGAVSSSPKYFQEQ